MSKKRTSAYWKKRFEALENASNAYGQQTFRQIEPAFDTAQKCIQSEIEKWYGRYAKNNVVTMHEARKQLSTTELKEFRWDVDEYIKYGRENDLNQMWMKELENASARVHVSRLEALKIRMQQAAEVAFGNEVDCIDAMARKVFTEDYYHSIFEVQKGFGIGWEIGQIDQRKLEKLIVKPWAADGKNFSERVWGQRTALVNELHQQLTRTCILDKAPDDAINAISKKFNTTKNQAGRLVMTEQAYFHSVAQQEAFEDLDVEEFEVVATLDSHTSEICQEMDGKHFPMKDYEPGVTAPPFHVWCRSVTVPWFEDNYTGERAARDEDGNTYYVPDSMTYKEWKNGMVDGNTNSFEPVDDVEKVINCEEAINTLTTKIGFDMVEDSFTNINEELMIDNTNQLMKLESKFGVIHKSTGTICSVPSGKAQAYVSSHVTNPLKQNLSLCPAHYKNKNTHIEGLLDERNSNWCMPFMDEEATIYNVTHEYGHMIQNMLTTNRMVEKGWSASSPNQFVNSSRKTRNAMFKWYKDIAKDVENECFSEIIAIAKEQNENFVLTDNISDYGKTDKGEFFAEVFANSQLGQPNELGKAMQIWLKKKGLI